MAAAVASPNDILATLQYYAPEAPVQPPADFRTPDGQKTVESWTALTETKNVKAHDIRGHEKDYTLKDNGFEYVHHALSGEVDWNSDDSIKSIVYPQVEELVKNMTGASRVLIFVHRVRNVSEDVKKLAESKAPAMAIHTDQSPRGAQLLLKRLISPEGYEQLIAGGNRVQVINVWRPLKTIRKDPLAVCDWQSVDAERDFVTSGMIFPEFEMEQFKMRPREGHRWCYLHQQRPEEPLVFLQYDSERGEMSAPHTAFVDERYVDCEPRESIEMKMFAFFDDE